MNRKLQDPFQHNRVPEVIEEFLDCGVAKCVAFNRRGTLLAAGTDDGHIVIWDFETRGPAKILNTRSEDADATAATAEAAAADGAGGGGSSSRSTRYSGPPMVTAVAWSRSGRHLVSASFDHRVILWEVLTGTQVWETWLPGHTTSMSLTARQPFRVLACPATTAPLLLDVATSSAHQLQAIDISVGPQGRPEVLATSTNGCAVFSREGDLVLVGQHKGVVTVYDTETQRVVDVFKLQQGVRILSLQLNRKGNRLLANCHDKVIRLFEVRPKPAGAATYSMEEVQQVLAEKEQGALTGSLLLGEDSSILSLCTINFRNEVERLGWRSVAVSGDSEWLAGAVLVRDQNEHRLHLWNAVTGKLEVLLEGPKHEGVLDLAWHPARLILVSVSTKGRLYIWSALYDENWSAFAPDFKELDENEEYVEAEDEFDLNPRPPPTDGAPAPAQELQLGLAHLDEDTPVDILTQEALRVFSSDDEDEAAADDAPLHWLPVVIEPFDEARHAQDMPVPSEAGKGGKAAAAAAAAVAAAAAAAGSSGGGAKRASSGGGAATSGSEQQQDEGDEDTGDEGAAAKLFVDGPRDRKRRVRFDDEYPTAGTGRRRGGGRPPTGRGGSGGRGSSNAGRGQPHPPAGGVGGPLPHPAAAVGGSGSQLNPPGLQGAMRMLPGGMPQHLSHPQG